MICSVEIWYLKPIFSRLAFHSVIKFMYLLSAWWIKIHVDIKGFPQGTLFKQRLISLLCNQSLESDFRASMQICLVSQMILMMCSVEIWYFVIVYFSSFHFNFLILSRHKNKRSSMLPILTVCKINVTYEHAGYS